MATIVRHPSVADYIVEMSLDEIAERPHGVTDLFEDGRLIIIKDYRLAFDHEALESLNSRIDGVEDERILRKLKKLEATVFFEGRAPETIYDTNGDPKSLRFDNPVRQALFETLCHGDPAIFNRASSALKSAHDELNRIFKACFPDYIPKKLVPSIRLTETLFENLHWDNHSMIEDFHQARIFCNLDSRKRIWNLGDHCLDYLEANYDQHGLAQFAERDPTEMLRYISKQILGGTTDIYKDARPRHNVAFDPGEVWICESRMIAHQIWYGQRATVYMWYVDINSMHDQGRRFNARIEDLHARMAISA